MRVRILSAILFLLFATQNLSGVTLTVTGNIINNFSSITLTITISQIDQASLSAGLNTTDQDFFTNYLDILLTDSDPINPIYKGNSPGNAGLPGSTTVGANSKFYFNLTQYSITALDDNQAQVVASIVIQNNPNLNAPVTLQSIAQTSGTGSIINVRANLNRAPKYTLNSQSNITPITTLNAWATSAPLNPQVISSHNAIRANWTIDSNTTYTDPTVSITPINMLIMIFDPNVDSLTLAGTQVMTTDGNITTQPADCIYSSVAPVNCVTCTTPQTFINSVQPNVPATANFISTANSGSYRQAGLDTNSVYRVALQYDQGLTQTQCFDVSPSNFLTLTELNGGAPAVQADPRCYIATAAFGSPFTQELFTLRLLRDKFLRGTYLGDHFINFYYSHSQPVADFVAQHPWAAWVARVTIMPLVWFTQFLDWVIG